MLKVVAILGLAAAAAVPVMASAEPIGVVEVGLPDGRLAASALTSGDFTRAVRRLSAVRPDAANDPARLINLGNAYAGMGRMMDAKAAYAAARYAPESMLVLADGSEASSRDIAVRALGRLEASYAMR